MLYLIELEATDGDFKITLFPSQELIAKYLKNNPTLSNSEYVIFEGELKYHKGRHIYDGRFQT
jgi:hypothetical protein